jgi:hypothetical protein
MAGEDNPLRLFRFISAYITSVEQILVLQILHEDPTRSWTTEELAKKLRSAELSIGRRLDPLYEKGVLLPQPVPGTATRHQFNPSSEEMTELVGLLLKAYRERPTWVIEQIYSPSPSAIQAFADAFKFRK